MFNFDLAVYDVPTVVRLKSILASKKNVLIIILLGRVITIFNISHVCTTVKLTR